MLTECDTVNAEVEPATLRTGLLVRSRATRDISAEKTVNADRQDVHGEEISQVADPTLEHFRHLAEETF
jgi:hypothetical protein